MSAGARGKITVVESVPAIPTKKPARPAIFRSGSAQSQLELNDIPENATEPGPGHYFGPGSQCFSALGEQRLAKSLSAPAYGFPETGWSKWDRVLISKGHSNSPAFLGKTSTGHEYNLKGTLGSKSTKMGTSLRPDLSLSLGIDPHGGPGPAYNLRDMPGQALGEGGQSGHRGFEPRPGEGRLNKSQGLAPRFDRTKPDSLGPGHYPRKDVALDTRTGRSIGVGRSSWEKVITPGWECEGRCKAGPGPGPPLWRDINQDGSRACSIGRAERFPRSKDENNPGPGQYDRNERAVGRLSQQHVSDTRSPNQVKFGTVPKKPRFRMILASKTSQRAGWGYF